MKQSRVSHGTCACGKPAFFRYLFTSGPRFYCQFCWYLRRS